jgi:prevent-host-death family protein
METVGAFAAKTHLSDLLERVERGERFTITRHGKPVAQLTPVDQRDPEAAKDAIAQMKAFRKRHTLGGVSLRDLIEEGRRY